MAINKREIFGSDSHPEVSFRTKEHNSEMFTK